MKRLRIDVSAEERGEGRREERGEGRREERGGVGR
jgi:hypothetical protein